MKRPIRLPTLLLAVGSALVLIGGVLTAGLTASAAGPTTVSLGAAASYAVFAAATITNDTGPTTINGDLGLHPGTSVTEGGAMTVNGTRNVTNAAALSARTLLKAAYADAAGRTPFTTVVGDTLGGKTFFPGVYRGGALDLPTSAPTVTLDAQGDASAVFIFQAASTLITAASTTVSLIGSAQSCNVFWQVGSSATLGASSLFRGTILAHTSISVGTSATVLDGRLLAGVGASTDSPSSDTGALTMLTNTITKPTCAAVPTPTPTATATPPPGGGGGGTPPPGGGGGSGGGSAPIEREPVAIAPTAAPAPARSAAPTAFPMDQGYPMVQGTPTPAARPTPGVAVSLPSSSTGGGDSSLILLTALSVIALSTVWLRSRRRDRDPAA